MKLHLKIITQEKQLLETDVDSVTVPTVEGELTILPMHIPLFTKITTGELVLRDNQKETSIVITDGFMDVGPKSEITVMVDSALRTTDIDLQKAEQARQQAEEIMKQKADTREFALAEASLRKAMMEIQTYHKRRGSGSSL